jgi:hypothetical protein
MSAQFARPRCSTSGVGDHSTSWGIAEMCTAQEWQLVDSSRSPVNESGYRRL